MGKFSALKCKLKFAFELAANHQCFGLWPKSKDPRNYLSCCCSWIFCLVYALSTSTTLLPLILYYFFIVYIIIASSFVLFIFITHLFQFFIFTFCFSCLGNFFCRKNLKSKKILCSFFRDKANHIFLQKKLLLAFWLLVF